jgi:hypothetical protein
VGFGAIDITYDVVPTWLEWSICGVGFAATTLGLIAGLTGLILPKATSRLAILSITLVGCLGNVLCLLPMIAWAVGEHDHEREAARERAASEVEARFKATTAELTILQKRMKEIAQNRRGEDAVAAQVYANVYAREKSILENYYRSMQPLSAGHLLSMREVEGQNEITRRRNLVQTMVSAAKEMEDFFNRLEIDVRRDLLDKGVSQKSAEKAAKALREGMGSSMERFNQMKDLRTRWAQNEIAGLDLLYTNWGKWTCSAETGKVEFQDQSKGVELERLIREINNLKRGMERIQQTFLNQK